MSWRAVHHGSKAESWGEILVNRRIQIWWDGNAEFFAGTITKFDPETRKYTVVYDGEDDDPYDEDLENEETRWEIWEEGRRSARSAESGRRVHYGALLAGGGGEGGGAPLTVAVGGGGGGGAGRGGGGGGGRGRATYQEMVLEAVQELSGNKGASLVSLVTIRKWIKETYPDTATKANVAFNNLTKKALAKYVDEGALEKEKTAYRLSAAYLSQAKAQARQALEASKREQRLASAATAAGVDANQLRVGLKGLRGERNERNRELRGELAAARARRDAFLLAHRARVEAFTGDGAAGGGDTFFTRLEREAALRRMEEALAAEEEKAEAEKQQKAELAKKAQAAAAAAAAAAATAAAAANTAAAAPALPDARALRSLSRQGVMRFLLRLGVLPPEAVQVNAAPHSLAGRVLTPRPPLALGPQGALTMADWQSMGAEVKGQGTALDGYRVVWPGDRLSIDSAREVDALGLPLTWRHVYFLEKWESPDKEPQRITMLRLLSGGWIPHHTKHFKLTQTYATKQTTPASNLIRAIYVCPFTGTQRQVVREFCAAAHHTALVRKALRDAVRRDPAKVELLGELLPRPPAPAPAPASAPPPPPAPGSPAPPGTAAPPTPPPAPDPTPPAAAAPPPAPAPAPVPAAAAAAPTEGPRLEAEGGAAPAAADAAAAAAAAGGPGAAGAEPERERRGSVAEALREAPPINEQPPSLTGARLHPHQLQGLAWLVHMYQNGVSAILGDQMGLGKTIQSIAFVAYLRDVLKVPGPHLVVVPLSVLSNWLAEAQRFCPTLRCVRFHGPRDERQRIKDEELHDINEFDMVVTTYEMLSSEAQFFRRRYTWRLVVVDEGHRLKNAQSQLAEKLRAVPAYMRLLLTGTPLQNNLKELWALLHFLMPDVFPAAAAANFERGFDLQKGLMDREHMEAARKLLGLLMLRRVKSEVDIPLPPKEEVTVMVKLSEAQQAWYRSLLGALDPATLARLAAAPGGAAGGEDGGGGGDGGGGITADDFRRLMNLLLQLRKVCNHPALISGEDSLMDEAYISSSAKLKLLDRMLPRLRRDGHRVLLFSQFTSMLDILEDYCLYRKYNYCRLDGETNRVQRRLDIRRYNAPGSKLFIFLVSTRAGGLGVNLATADTVVLYDSDWNPQVDLQAMERAHRIGQTRPVTIYRLVCRGSVEERMVSRASKKLLLSALVAEKKQKRDDDEEEGEGIGGGGGGEEEETLEEAAAGARLDKKELASLIRFGANAVFDKGGEGELNDEELDAVMGRGDGGGGGDGEAAAAAAGEGAAAAARRAAAARAALLQRAAPIEEVDLRALEGRLYQKGAEAGKGSEDPSDLIQEGERQRKERIVLLQGKGTGYGKTFVPVLAENAENSDEEVVEKTEVKSRLGRRQWEHIDLCFVCKLPAIEPKPEKKRKKTKKSKKPRRPPPAPQPLGGCTFCPRSYHADCLEAQGAARTGDKGMVVCPHHRCRDCDRNTSSAGGLLFRCLGCCAAFCEDCLPEDEVESVGRSLEMEALGYYSKQAYYIRCEKCLEGEESKQEGASDDEGDDATNGDGNSDGRAVPNPNAAGGDGASSSSSDDSEDDSDTSGSDGEEEEEQGQLSPEEAWALLRSHESAELFFCGLEELMVNSRRSARRAMSPDIIEEKIKSGSYTNLQDFQKDVARLWEGRNQLVEGFATLRSHYGERVAPRLRPPKRKKKRKKKRRAPSPPRRRGARGAAAAAAAASPGDGGGGGGGGGGARQKGGKKRRRPEPAAATPPSSSDSEDGEEAEAEGGEGSRAAAAPPLSLVGALDLLAGHPAAGRFFARLAEAQAEVSSSGRRRRGPARLDLGALRARARGGHYAAGGGPEAFCADARRLWEEDGSALDGADELRDFFLTKIQTVLYEQHRRKGEKRRQQQQERAKKRKEQKEMGAAMGSRGPSSPKRPQRKRASQRLKDNSMDDSMDDDDHIYW